MSTEVKPFILIIDVIIGNGVEVYTINNAVSWDTSGDRAHGDFEVRCEKSAGMTERFFGDIVCVKELPLESSKEG